MVNTTEVKEYSFELKELDRERSTFEGFSAGVGNRDSYDDIILSGAFTKTIEDRVAAGKVKWLDQHSYFSTKALWGNVVEAGEVEVPANLRGRHDGATALIWSKFLSSRIDPNAQIALGKIEEGILDALSIGFSIVKVEFESDEEDSEDPVWDWIMGNGTRMIIELKWWETSSVIWGANSAALVIPGTVKSLLHFTEVAKAGEGLTDEVARSAMITLGRAVKGLRQRPDVIFADASHREVDKLITDLDPAIKAVDKNVKSATADKLAQLTQEFRNTVWDATPKSVHVTKALQTPKKKERRAPPEWAGALFEKLDSIIELLPKGGDEGAPEAEPEAALSEDVPEEKHSEEDEGVEGKQDEQVQDELDEPDTVTGAEEQSDAEKLGLQLESIKLLRTRMTQEA